MAEHEVKLHVYDLSKGMARQLSLVLLGRQIEGVWHTGVLVYGQEYFFGSMGIATCPPCGTILGQPDQVIDMGRTQVTQDLFEEYLRGLGASEFRGSSYHLLEHNCNNFSSEVTQFLTGSPIPAHITNLPQDVMNTPFGASIRPLIEAFTGGSRFVSYDDLPQPYVHSTSTHSQPTSSSMSEGKAAELVVESKALSSATSTTPDIVRRLDSLPRSPARSTRQELLANVEEVVKTAGELDLPVEAQTVLARVGDALRSESSEWPQPSKGWTLKGLVRIAGQVMTRGTLSSQTPDPAKRLRLQRAGMDVLSVVLAVPGGVQHYISSQHLLMRLLSACSAGSRKSVELQRAVFSMLAQLTAIKEGRQYVCCGESWSLSQQQKTTNLELCIPLLVDGVLSSDAASSCLAVRAMHNISLVESLPSSTALECGTAIAEVIQRLGDSYDESAKLAVLSLARFSAHSEELRSLLPALGLNLTYDTVNEDIQVASKLLHELILEES